MAAVLGGCHRRSNSYGLRRRVAGVFRGCYADTLDAQIVLLACLPPANRTESFVALLTPATMSLLQAASLELVFGKVAVEVGGICSES
jgi:predicted YcjX-like family ATPase